MDENGISDDKYEIGLLEQCSEFNFMLDSEKEKKDNGAVKKFVAKLRTAVYKTKDPLRLEATLSNYHCIQAISSCGREDLGYDFLMNLFAKHTKASKNYLKVFGELQDYSFLTVEMASVLFEERNAVLRPFAVTRLLETVKLEVLLHLLEMWEFELRSEDAKSVICIWGKREEFLAALEKDARSWLLWKKACVDSVFLGAEKPFPLRSLLDSLIDPADVEKYENLMLAFILESEKAITFSFGQLEAVHASFHLNDWVVEQHMPSDMILDLDSRKWDLWHEAGKAHFEVIIVQMTMRKQLIDALLSLRENIMTNQSEASMEALSQLAILHEFTVLLQTPLSHFSRNTFIKSRDIDMIISACENAMFYFPHFYSPIVTTNVLNNPSYWIVLWKQLELLEIDLAYNEEISEKFADPLALMKLLNGMLLRMNSKSSYSRSFYWLTELVVAVLSPWPSNLEDSNVIMDILMELTKDSVCELSYLQLNFIHAVLHPEATSKNMSFFRLSSEIFNFTFEAFKLAPEILEPAVIERLLMNPISRELMLLSKPQNATKLMSLAAFSLKDLQDFFPIGTWYSLEDCVALHTLQPSVLADFLNDSSGVGFNYPEKLIWRVHPRFWDNLNFVDAVSELIPFDSLLKYPAEAAALNFISIITDIMGRIRRNPENSQKLILKWIINMDWLFLQHFIMFCNEESVKLFSKEQYSVLANSERGARADLITWLKSQNYLQDCDELLALVERVPLSHIRTAHIYDMHFIDAIKNNADNASSLPQFTIFSEKDFYQVNSSYLEGAISQALFKCDGLIEKYFNSTEKQIWSNRLKIQNIPNITKYLFNPVRTSFAKGLFENNASPYADLIIAAAMFTRSGYIFCKESNSEEEYLIPSPKILEICKKLVVIEENVHTKGRSILIRNEMEKRKRIKDEKKQNN